MCTMKLVFLVILLYHLLMMLQNSKRSNIIMTQQCSIHLLSEDSGIFIKLTSTALDHPHSGEVYSVLILFKGIFINGFPQSQTGQTIFKSWSILEEIPVVDYGDWWFQWYTFTLTKPLSWYFTLPNILVNQVTYMESQHWQFITSSLSPVTKGTIDGMFPFFCNSI